MNKRFGFFYDRDKYSIKELISNYLVAFAWLLSLLTIILNFMICHEYLSNMFNNKLEAIKPWIFDRLNRLAFIFFAAFITGIVLKIIYKRKRNKGTLLSANEMIEMRVKSFDQLDKRELKKNQYLTIKICYWAVSVIGLLVLMLAVWVF